MIKEFSSLILILTAILAGCSKQQGQNEYTGQTVTSNMKEGSRDNLLKLYDQMILERQERLKKYSNDIKNNPNSADLFYQRALVKLEMLNLQEALSECSQYKDSSGHREKKEPSSLFAVLQDRSEGGLGEEIKSKITGHADCFKIAESANLANAYQERVMAVSYEDIHEPIRDLSKAIELDPRLSQAYLYRTKYAKRQNQENEQEQLQDYSAALNLKQDAQTFLKRALLNYQHADLNDALVYRDCMEAIRLNPRYSDAYILKALVEWPNSSCENIESYQERKVCERKTAERILNDLKTALAIEPDFPLLQQDVERYSKALEEDNPESWGFSSEYY